MFKIRIPATTANLGTGFDTLGLALNLYNEFIFEEIEEGLEILGCIAEYSNEDNLVYRSLIRTLAILDYDLRGIRITFNTKIPESRGLGSSASCVLAGVMAGNEIAKGNLSSQEILDIAVEIEGHPDNIIPAYLGGLTVSSKVEDRIIYNEVEIRGNLDFLAIIPDFTLSTKKAREVLPDQISHSDGVHNGARLALLLSALVNGRFDLLKYGLDDRLHQPYRKHLINNYDDIVNRAMELGALGAYLSGAGPTIMVLIDGENIGIEEELTGYLESLKDRWIVKRLGIEKNGGLANNLGKMPY